ncbi:MAG TPA: ribbon-helix-helix domain-containing protein [Steroidobacteraceae bacterium]|jgi:predicted DNA-binding protein|nr:ribbon-helix-helix domain-containing protein [Steroidobacteraceae bacterium]
MAAQPVNVKPVNVYLTHQQHEQLRKLKEKTGAPVSELIRRAIDQYLKTAEPKR